MRIPISHKQVRSLRKICPDQTRTKRKKKTTVIIKQAASHNELFLALHDYFEQLEPGLEGAIYDATVAMATGEDNGCPASYACGNGTWMCCCDSTRQYCYPGASGNAAGYYTCFDPSIWECCGCNSNYGCAVCRKDINSGCYGTTGGAVFCKHFSAAPGLVPVASLLALSLLGLFL
ncbi:hypothetical protein Pelo_12819 [Pelomyxa schiedti]|nr:hypothetical protein Pelo_12819 [Pelomyxa schiedti]